MITNEHKKTLLKTYPILSSLPKALVERVFQNGKVIELAAGAVVFEELQSCSAFPFVLSGSLRVVKRSETGKEISLYNVDPGDACVVSSACLLGNKPYDAVGLVQSNCELVMMPAKDFNDLLSIEVFREFIFSLFSKRVLDLMQLIDEVAFRKLDQRLARLLISRQPSVELSHQQSADELGTAREMVTRILSGFSDRQLVRLNRGSIQVLDLKGLEKVCAN